MAFTFTVTQQDPVAGICTVAATTDTSSAAGTFNPGFEPTKIEVYDITNQITYIWVAGMADASMRKIAAAGTQTDPSSNGITVVGVNDASPARSAVTLGTGCHTNSSTYKIICHR